MPPLMMKLKGVFFFQVLHKDLRTENGSLGASHWSSDLWAEAGSWIFDRLEATVWRQRLFLIESIVLTCLFGEDLGKAITELMRARPLLTWYAH